MSFIPILQKEIPRDSICHYYFICSKCRHAGGVYLEGNELVLHKDSPEPRIRLYCPVCKSEITICEDFNFYEPGTTDERFDEEIARLSQEVR
jgi:hypothetical protein